MVTIRSGVVPSLMLIRAPLYSTEEEIVDDDDRRCVNRIYFISNGFYVITALANDAADFLERQR